jgi:hypothetical protein
MKLLVMQFSPFSRLFIPLRSKYPYEDIAYRKTVIYRKVTKLNRTSEFIYMKANFIGIRKLRGQNPHEVIWEQKCEIKKNGSRIEILIVQ